MVLRLESEFTVTVEASLAPGGGGDTARHLATLPFGRPRPPPLPDVRSTRSIRSLEDRSREPFADFASRAGRAEAPLRRSLCRRAICCFSGEGCREAISHASDSTAAHC